MRIIALIIATLFIGFTLPAFAEHGESCQKQAKEKGLKGAEHKAFVKECKAARKAEHAKKHEGKEMHEGKEKMHEGKEKMHEKEDEGKGKGKDDAAAKPAEPKK
jgi:hypothetical protein